MAVFQYQALTQAGRMMRGTVEAGTPDEAAQTLKRMELNVSSLEKARQERPKTVVGRNEFLLFNQQLASITKAGIPLERGLRELAQDVSSKPMRRLIDDIAADLEAGVPIEEAFAMREKHFPPLYGRILKAGVETGRLSEMLTSLNRHLELAGRTRRIVVEALTYPLVVMALSAIVITGVLVFVIPQFSAVLEEMVTGQLNPVTTMVVQLSRHIVPFWIGAGVLIGLLIALVVGLSTTPAGRRIGEKLFLRIPLTGGVYRDTVLSRMAEAMAVLIGAGCDIPEALRLGAVTSGSENLVVESEQLADQVERGTNLLEAAHRRGVLPRLFLYSVQLGAQRNELQDNLYSLGQMYADRTHVGQSRLQTLLLPILIFITGGIIGLVVLAIFLPMIQVVTSLSAAG